MASQNKHSTWTPALLSVLFFLLRSSIALSQHNYVVEHFTAENGLPQNSVKSIAVDSDSFVWLATEDGLTRFDGRKFQVFTKDKIGVSTNRLVCILPGRENPRNSSQIDVAYAWFNSNEKSILKNGVAAPVHNQLLLWDKQMAVLNRRIKGISVINGLPERWPRSIAPDQSTLITERDIHGNFYLCDQKKVAYYQKWKKKYEVANKAPERLNFFSLKSRLFYFDGKASLVQVFNGKRTIFPLKGDILENKLFVSSVSAVKLYWNNNSDQTFLYLGTHLYELILERDGSPTTKLLTTGFDLRIKGIDVIHHDHENRKLLLGSSTDGLFVISLPQFGTIKVSGPNRPNIFYAQWPYDRNSILTPTGIIAGKDPKTNQIIDRRHSSLENLNPADSRVIFQDKKGYTWVKARRDIIRINKNGQLDYRWTFKNLISSFYQTSDSSYLIGVLDEGIYKLSPDPRAAAPRLIETKYAKQINCIGLRNGSEIWMGASTGLYTVNLKNGKTRIVKGTAGINIKSIQTFETGTTWVTALDHGIILVEASTRITRFPLDRDGRLASAHCIVNDGKGFLWVPTNRGLFQLKISDLLSYAKKQTGNSPKHNEDAAVDQDLFYGYHGMDEGFGTNEFNGSCSPCGLKLENGFISLPSLDGLVWFKPEEVKVINSPGGIILDQIQVGNQQVQPVNGTIQLPLKPENIKLKFATAYFGQPNNLSVSYALTAADDSILPSKWQRLDQDSRDITIQFSNISPGSHVLTIRKRAGFGENNLIEKKIRIIVPTPWYENSLAYLGFGLLGVAFSYLIVRLRFKSIERRNKFLEQQICQRTDELRHTLATLETSQQDLLEQFHIQSRLLTSLAHDLRSPLSAAMLVNGEVRRQIGQGQYDRAVMLSHNIEDAVGLIKQSIDELVTYVKIQFHSKQVNLEKVALSKLVDRNFEIYAKSPRINPNFFRNDVPEDAVVITNPQLLDILLRNLTDNANKYTQNGVITARWCVNSGPPALTISDTGRGLPPSLIEWLTSGDNASTLDAFDGIGLVIVKDLAPFANVSIQAQSGTNGTQITLIFS